MLQNKIDEHYERNILSNTVINGDLNPSNSFTGSLLDISQLADAPAKAVGLNGADTSSIWDGVLAKLKDKLDPQIFAAWIEPLSVSHLEYAVSDDGTQRALVVDIGAPNKFCCDHVRRSYGELLDLAFQTVTNVHLVELNYQVMDPALAREESVSREAQRAAKSVTVASRNGTDPVALVNALRDHNPVLSRRGGRKLAVDACNLNAKYNFSNFVIGQCNQFAHAASLRVAENPGGSYNPLFIYGGVGLGKTHLVNAIGNAARRRGKSVLLISSETFVNELITALRGNKMQEFKERFRSLDLLVIDDIQFIIGKERTQEEFFHTFNALYQRRSQIVITSDKVPQELTGLEERLRTRFASGLSADLQAPDFETRVAILQKKSEAESILLPNSVASFLAEKIDTNVRELEGALNRLNALSAINGIPITLELAEDALRTIVPDKTREITIELIQKTVAERFNTTVKDLLGKRRTQHIALPRQVAMHLSRKLTTCSYPEIGSLFGGRDHSTVIHANRVIEDRIREDDHLRQDLEAVERKLRGR